MLMLQVQTPVRELVRERPWLQRVLIAYNIEPASDEPLARMCRARQVNLDEISLHLQQIWDGPEGLRRLNPAQLLDYIVHCHHRYLRKVLPQLLAQARALAQQDEHYQAVCIELAEFSQEANPHMFREEMEVFPAIREGATQRAPHLTRWISRLEQEHGQALQHFLALRRAQAECQQRPEAMQLLAGLTELDEDMRWHMYAENDLLFPRFRLSA